MSEETHSHTWPKSTRLNQQNRAQFVDTVVADLMPDDKAPDEERDVGAKYGDSLYEHIFGDHVETMKLLPSWMFKKSSEFKVDLFKHQNQNDPIVKGNRGMVSFKMSKEGLMPHSKGRYSWDDETTVELSPDSEHEAIQAYKDFCQQESDWQARQRELRQTLTKVAEACNTSHQLFRAWPQAVKYAQECFPYVEPAEAKRGGQTDVSTEQLDLTAKLAQTVVGGVQQN